jgi:thiol-disulfide isomerase/thioredoxin
MNAKLGYILIAVIILVIVFLYIFTSCSGSTNTQTQPKSEEGYKHTTNNQIGDIVLYYSTSCGFCKMFMPTWEQFEQHAAANIQGLTVKKVKCEGDGEQLCFEKGIQGYPTVIIYLTDGKQVMFQKNRTMEDLIQFVNENKK